jgi:hypothetical protein
MDQIHNLEFHISAVKSTFRTDMDRVSKLNQAVCDAIVLIAITGMLHHQKLFIKFCQHIGEVWAPCDSQQRVICHRASHKGVAPCKSDSFIIFECDAPHKGRLMASPYCC